MTAYIVLFRHQTHDENGMKVYAELASQAPMSKLELVASSKLGAFNLLEGEGVETAVIMRFPSQEDAMAWYDSPEYTKARKHRMASGEFTVALIDGCET